MSDHIVPVFIGGCGRSGTTFLGSLLSSHIRCVATPESPFKIDLLRYCSLETTKNYLSNESIKSFLSKNFYFNTWNISFDNCDIHHNLNQENRDQTSCNKIMIELVKNYVRKFHCEKNFQYWIDHTPNNIMYAVSLLEQFPNAKFIHIVRDGRAVAASVIPLDWGPNTVSKATRWWLTSLSYGLSLEKKIAPEKILRVSYESLVLNTAKTMDKIADFLNLSFSDQYLQEKPSLLVTSYTRNQHSLVNQKPNADRVYSWKYELSSREIELFEYYTGDILCYLGYEMMYGLKALPPTFSEKLISSIKELLYSNIVNKVRLYQRRISRDSV
jgi:hypothetical protein